MAAVPSPTDRHPVTAEVRVLVPGAAERAFDFFADLRNEPSYNGQVSQIEKTSPGPIGLGTTFAGLHRGLGRVTWQLVEYDRPTHVSVAGRVGDGGYRWTSDFSQAGAATVMVGRMEWEPPRRWRFLRPLLAAILGLNARRSFNRMARVLNGTR